MPQDDLLRLIDQAAEEGWKTLDLSGKNLTGLPPEIGKLTQLETLILGKRQKRWGNFVGNQLKTLPAEIGKLINLKTLLVEGNQLESLPIEVGQLRQLRILMAGENRLTQLPRTFEQLTKLRVLIFDENKFPAIPSEIAQLHHLKTLRFYDNSLENVFDEITQLTALKSLNLSNNQLSSLPPEITQLTALKLLSIGSNKFSSLPPEITQLSSLKSLDLSNNQLSSLPPEITQLTALKLLSIGSNKFSSLPPEITQLTALKSLNLSNNQLSSLPPEITQLTALKSLSISSNKFSSLPPEITQLSSLKSLNLRSNQLSSLSPEIGQLTSLQSLSLWGNQLSSLPPEITQLTALKSLSLWDNQFSSLPPEITQLTALKSLDLSFNQLSSLPPEITQLTALKSLDLSNSQLSSLPPEIAQLALLQSLNLGSNQLSSLPPEIAQLALLQSLNLSSNQLSSLPPEITQFALLQSLNLGSNQLSSLPPEITQLASLQSLDLGSNQLSSLPPEITQLASLQSLNLSSNQLSSLPPEITQLVSLQSLNLSSNQLSSLPPEITQLASLQSLNLSSNCFKQVPDGLEALPQLQKLDLRRNSLPISPEILGPPELHRDPGAVEGIFNYLRLLRSGEVKPLNEAKLLLVGQGSVGKTSLVKRLIDDHFNKNEPQTDGLNVSNWMIHINSKDVRLNVWDFGGQEIYHATHQFFLTKRSLYLLVCNCRTSEEENRLEYWLKLIQSFGGESPVIIVGNKKDEQPLDINRKALREKYPNIRAILETSCQSGDGIGELRTAIHEEVGQLHDVYNLLPLSWFEVKERLEAMQVDFISYSKYIGICYENQISEEHNQEQLIELLHNLGLVLNFREHPLLKDTNVLNPDWVTKGIYALLSDEILKTETKGILTYEDLSRVLDSERYPANRHHYLTDLMQEFQLCFALPDCASPKFLIPGLLPKDEPYETDLGGDTLDFQYHYRILPEGVMSRFIVLSHEQIHEQICWRSGVMLAYREGDEVYNIARIRADSEDRKIFISVSGREQTRRSHLFQIRATFNKIHTSFADLVVTEHVPIPKHPDHPPLDYQELLGLEAMGDQTVTIGKLRLRLNLRQLLDGYDSYDSRQRQQRRKHNIDIEHPDGFGDIEVNIVQSKRDTHQYGENDNVAGDSVQGDKYS